MDFDGDGKLDLVSGSYDPGELYLFRGQGGGKYAARETLKDKTGKPILRVPNQKDPVESFGSWMTLVDWAGTGKLDILVGGFDGTMFVRRNVGTRTKPEYAAENTWVMVGSKKLRVPGGEHANPVVADWDGDGRWDLITGSGNGGVYWYRNTGEKSEPRFDAPVALVPNHKGIGYSEMLSPDQQPRPGIRSQIAVTDFDGDGKLDVLLGDFCTYIHIRKDLTPEQQKKFDDLRKQQGDVGKTLSASLDAIRERYKEMLKGVPKSEWNNPENSKKWNDLYQGMRTSKPYQTAMAEHEKLKKDLQQFVERPGGLKKDLTPEQLKKYAALQDRIKHLESTLSRHTKEALAKYEEMMKGVPRSEWNTPERINKWNELHAEMQKRESYQAAAAEKEKLQAELQHYHDGPSGKSLGEDPAVAHGYVWLFRRK